MPDLLSILSKHKKRIWLLTITAVALAIIGSILSPKKYLSTATALPANSVLKDKGRLFNSNIESLYPSLGSADELDRIEGTARLDTLYIAVANEFNLAEHYAITHSKDPLEAALFLKKNTQVSRSAYGELKVKVWDKDRVKAADLANALLQKLNEFHVRLQQANDIVQLRKMQLQLATLRSSLLSYEKEIAAWEGRDEIHKRGTPIQDSIIKANAPSNFEGQSMDDAAPLRKNFNDYQKLVAEYQLSVALIPDVLVIVENARPSLTADTPKIVQNVFFAFFGALLFSMLLAVLFESRNKSA